MFAHPVLRAVMTSSGSIPVQRSPDGPSAADVRFALLRETFRALDADEVVGVFPEGTSYTAPRIAQVKEGAAWVALEYARWQLQHAAAGAQGKQRKLTLVPVGIVYSDKTRFKSRVGRWLVLLTCTRRSRVNCCAYHRCLCGLANLLSWSSTRDVILRVRILESKYSTLHGK